MSAQNTISSCESSDQVTPDDGSQVETRVNNRASYTTCLQFAPFDGQELPSSDDFLEAFGNDLSETGLSFLAQEDLSNQHLVLKLKRGVNKFAYLTAKVVRTEQDEQGWETGCVFTGEAEIS